MLRVSTIAAVAALSIATAVPAHSEDRKSCKAIKDGLSRITGVPSLVCTSTAGLTSARLAAQTTPQPPQPRTSLAQPGLQWPDRGPGNYGEELEARADRMFGRGLVYNPAREQWLADQEQRRIDNEINRSKPLIYPVGSR